MVCVLFSTGSYAIVFSEYLPLFHNGGFMTERASDRFDDIKSKIEKSINPYITLKIKLPENVDKKEFMELENNQEFIELVSECVRDWIETNKARKVSV